MINKPCTKYLYHYASTHTKCLFLILGLACIGSITAEASGLAATSHRTRLPAIFGDNMVLQRNADVNIWGWDQPGKSVEINPSWGEPVVAVPNESGYWIASVSTLDAGGPHELVIQGTDQIEIGNILFGEVWICSGQSNMEMPLKGYRNQPIIDSQEEILKAHKPAIRLLIVNRQKSDEPVSDFQGQWEVCTPETSSEFSAVGYFFGSKLQETLGVPVGLIGSYWGATSAEVWTDRDVLEKMIPEDQLSAEIAENRPGPGQLWNGMIHPLVPYAIKGVIWYQGESNRTRPEAYPALLAAMVEDWRKQWGSGEFPFYYVQIAPFRYEGADGTSSALLREAQLKATELIPNSGMVVSLDHGVLECIHPFNKKPIGNRLANFALREQYGFNYVQAKGPTLKEMKINGERAILSFANAPNGLIYMDAELGSFEMAGADKVFHSATAKVTREGTIILSSPEVPEPVAVRYAFKNYPEATLFNVEGIPASSFRTDDW